MLGFRMRPFTDLVPALVLAVVFSTGVPARAVAQSHAVEQAGDVIGLVALPGVALGSTLLLKDYQGSQRFLVGFALNAAVTKGLKLVANRTRPDLSDDESFPSGHTSIAFQAAGFIHFEYGLRYGIPAYAGAAFVGVSRVDADRHHTTDVLAGAALGTLSSLLVHVLRSADPDSDVGLDVAVSPGVAGGGRTWTLSGGFSPGGR